MVRICRSSSLHPIPENVKRLSSLAAILVALAPAVEAQRSYPQEKMKANFADMQTHSWFTGGGWLLDFEAAKAKSKATGKPIFAYFTRTYSP